MQNPVKLAPKQSVQIPDAAELTVVNDADAEGQYQVEQPNTPTRTVQIAPLGEQTSIGGSPITVVNSGNTPLTVGWM